MTFATFRRRFRARSLSRTLALAAALGLAFALPARAQIPGAPRIPSPPSTPPSSPKMPSRPFTPAEKEYKKQMEAMQKEIAKQQKTQQEKSKTVETELEKLLDEFGPTARYGIYGNFLFIYDTSDDYAKWCATLIENAGNAYLSLAKKMKFGIGTINEPMAVIIFSREEDYQQYLKKILGTDFENAKNKPIGCYFPGANRSVFYDMTGVERGKIGVDADPKKSNLEDVSKEILARPNAEDTLSVVVHETIHEVTYNLKLFESNGNNPAWAVEGIAMLFEPPCGEQKYGGWKPGKDLPVNKRRIAEFLAYAEKTKDEEPVKKVVLLDSVRPDEEGAYPVSWALFYYLYLKHPRQLSAYLCYNQSVQPRMTYSEAQKIQEFAYFFGTDWKAMYLELRAFVEALDMVEKGVEPELAEKQARAKYGLPEEEKDAGKGKGKKKEKEEKAEKSPENAEKPAEKPAEEKAEEKKEEASKPAAKPKKFSKDKGAPQNDDDDWLNSWSKGGKK